MPDPDSGQDHRDETIVIAVGVAEDKVRDRGVGSEDVLNVGCRLGGIHIGQGRAQGAAVHDHRWRVRTGALHERARPGPDVEEVDSELGHLPGGLFALDARVGFADEARLGRAQTDLMPP